MICDFGGGRSATFKNPSRRALLFFALLMIILWQIPNSYYQVAAPLWMNNFSIGFERMGLVFFFAALGAFVAGAAGSLLSKRLTLKGTYVFALATCAVASFLALSAGGLPIFTLSAFLFAAALAFCNIVGTAVLAEYGGSDRRRWIFISRFCASASATFAFFVLSDLAERLARPGKPALLLMPFAAFGLLAIVLLVIVVPTNLAPAVMSEDPGESPVRTSRRRPISFLALVALCVFLNGSSELALISWLSTFAERRFQVGSRLSGWIPTAFLGGAMAGKLLFAWLPRGIKDWTIVAAGTALGAAFVIVGLHASSYSAAIGALGLAGMFIGANLPAMLAIVGARFTTESSRAYSVVWATNAAALMAGPYFYGWLAALLGSMQKSLSFTAVGFTALSGVAVAVAIIQRSAQKRSEP